MITLSKKTSRPFDVTRGEKQGRNACSTFLIVDVQSVKNTDTAVRKGYDAGKKVSGIKRHIVVDTQGLPHAVGVTTAEVTDRKGALQALAHCKPGLKPVQSLLCDSGYVGKPFAEGVREILGWAGHRANCQAQRTAHLQGHAQALGGGAQCCLAGEKSQTVEKLRAQTQHQLAVHPFGLPGFADAKTVNRL